MSDTEEKRKRDLLRAEVLEVLARLTPGEAKALRKRFGIDLDKTSALPEDADVDALLRELAATKKKH
jgi:DNA-directed RNA polymerase sigma subunit (sigma70/sigma32)